MVEMIRDVLLDETGRASGLHDPAVVEADLRAGGWRDHRALWRAVNAQLWVRSLTARPAMESAR